MKSACKIDFIFPAFYWPKFAVFHERLSVSSRLILVKSGSDEDTSKLNLTVFFIESVPELLRMIVRWLVVGDKGWSGFENISFHQVTKPWSNDGRAKVRSNLGNVAADMAVGSERGSKDGDAVIVLRCTDCRWDSWEGRTGTGGEEARNRDRNADRKEAKVFSESGGAALDRSFGFTHLLGSRYQSAFKLFDQIWNIYYQSSKIGYYWLHAAEK